MDINVKGVPDNVAKRLAEQAAAEGVSQQEWIRQVLSNTARRLSPQELVRRRAEVSPMSAAEFDAIAGSVARGHHVGLARTSATRRRR